MRLGWLMMVILLGWGTAQSNPVADSLHGELLHLRGAKQITAYNALGWSYRHTHPDSLVYYASHALTLAQQQQDIAGQALSYNRLGWGLHLQGDWEQALEVLHRAYQLAENNQLPLEQARACINLGIVHKHQSNYPRAIIYQLEALHWCQQMDRSDWTAKCHNNLGSVYRHQGDLLQALSHYSKSLELYRKFDPSGIPKAYQNIGNLYFEIDSLNRGLHYYRLALQGYTDQGQTARAASCMNNLGSLFLAKNLTDTAKTFLDEALSIFGTLQNNYEIGNVLNNLALLHEIDANFNEALNAYKKCLKVTEQLQDSVGLAITLNNLGHVYLKLQQEHLASASYAQGLVIAQALGDDQQQYVALLGLAEGREREGNFTEANRLLREALPLADTLAQRSSNEELLALLLRLAAEEAEYQWQLQQQAAALQTTTRGRTFYRTLTWASLGLLLLLSLGWLGYRFRQKMLRLREQAARQAHQFEQMQHTRKEERRRIGGELHDSLGALLFYASSTLEQLEQQPADQKDNKLQHTRQLIDQARSMVREVSHKLTLNAYSPDGLAASLRELKQSVDATGSTTLHLSLEGSEQEPHLSLGVFIHQACMELVSNSLKHAQATEVHLMIQVQPEHLTIHIKDNGIAAQASETNTGIGLDRLTTVTTLMGGTMIVSSNPSFQVTLQVPNQPIDTYADKNWYS